MARRKRRGFTKEYKAEVEHRRFSATRLCWSKRNGGCDDSMKPRFSSSGCEARPARGEPARAGSEPGDGLGNETGEA